MEFDVPKTQWGTPPGIILDKLLAPYSDVYQKKDLQHVTLLQVDAFKTETLDIISFVDEIRVPSRPKRVNRDNLVFLPKLTDNDPIFASLENHHYCPKAFGVEVEGTDGTSCPYQRPFHM
jgi:hypothetical protein